MSKIGRCFGAIITAMTLGAAAAAVAEPHITPVTAPVVVSAPGKEVAKEKMIYLFHRRDEWSREHFQLHYVETHAQLGLRWTRNLLGYSVNLIQTPSHTDALTEQWVPTAMDMLDAKNSYASPEDFAHVAADRISDGKTGYYVVQETVLKGAPQSTPLFQQTPGVKVIWSYSDAAKLPPVPSGATRVVDNRVTRKLDNTLSTEDKPVWRAVPSDVAVFRMAWADKLEDLGKPESYADAMIVREYRFRASPWK